MNTAEDRGENNLADRLNDGDERAFETLFSLYYAPLCSFANGFVQAPDVAEEIVQDIFLRVWEQRRNLQIYSSIRTYLYVATRNYALNYLKHQRITDRIQREATATNAAYGHSQAKYSSEHSLYFGELSNAFDEAIRELPASQQRAIVLRWKHNMSYKEIGEILGIQVKSVETQIARAIKKIREKLETFR